LYFTRPFPFLFPFPFLLLLFFFYPFIPELCESKPASTVKEIVDALEEAIESGDEGIMIKRLDSHYRPDERKNNWIKLKPEYVDGVRTPFSSPLPTYSLSDFMS